MAFAWTKVESVRKFLGGLKDKTSHALAKAKGSDFKDLDIAILRATSHEECLPDERYVWDIIATTKHSQLFTNHTVHAIARRLGKTHNWVVALKGLMLADRLLRNGSSYYKDEFQAYMINMANFRDDSNMTVAWDYSAFVRLYSRYLEESLKCLHNPVVIARQQQHQQQHQRQQHQRQQQQQSDDVVLDALQLLERLPPQQQLLERLMATQPAGGASSNRLVLVAFEGVVVESFALYRSICDGITSLLPQFQDLDRADAVRALDICRRAQKQFQQLTDFYATCSKNGTVPRHMEIPPVVEVAEEHLQALEGYIRDLAPDSDGKVRQASRYLGDTRTETATEASSDDDERRSLPRRPSSSRRPTSASPAGARTATGYNNTSRGGGRSSSSATTPAELRRHREDDDGVDADFLGLKSSRDQQQSSLDQASDALALALFSSTSNNAGTSSSGSSSRPGQQSGSGTPATNSSSSSGWVAFSDQSASTGYTPSTSSASGNGHHHHHHALTSSGSGLELVLPQSSREMALVPSSRGVMAGGFDNLLLDSLYDEAAMRQKYYGNTHSTAPVYAATGSVPQLKSNNPFVNSVTPAQMEHDPFAASATVAPPGWVQREAMTKATATMTMEQQAWQQYQMSGYMAQMNPYAMPSSTAAGTALPPHVASSYPSYPAYGMPSSALVLYNGR